MDGNSLPHDIHKTTAPNPSNPPATSALPPSQGKAVFLGVPSCTQALLRAARLGGAWGYREVGHQVGEHLCSNVPFDVESPDDWVDLLDHEVVKVIQALPTDEQWINHEHLAPLLKWLNVHFPGVTSQVPPRHHGKLTQGFVQGVVASGNWML